MRTAFAIIGFVVVALVVGTCVACVDNDDKNSLGRIQFVSHQYDDGGDEGYGDEQERCYDGDCGDQNYDQWNSDQRNHNRRNRGAFSPGPFDDSPVDAFNGNVICLPGSYCTPDDRRRDENPPEGSR